MGSVMENASSSRTCTCSSQVSLGYLLLSELTNVFIGDLRVPCLLSEAKLAVTLGSLQELQHEKTSLDSSSL